MYEPAWHKALNELGINCRLFDCHALTLPGLLGRVERRILAGPGIRRIRRNLLQTVKQERPDVTLLYQGHYCDRDTVEQLRHITFVAGYHNDDPFDERQSMLRYRHFFPALPLYNGFHVYRQCNVQDAINAGVPRVKVLMSYYLPWMDYPRKLLPNELSRCGCDVVFAGHCENDMRLECITGLVRDNIRTRIYGGKRYWKPALPGDIYAKVKPIPIVFGEDYRKAICGAKIALSFFSKWNRDQYTRRVFEIPACGAFLLCERTPVMQELFVEGTEAEFFSSTRECLDKAMFYLKNDTARQKIAEAGYLRVTTSGHDIYSRMKQWLADISLWRKELVTDTKETHDDS
ncbi:MAG: glycosyltransferase [Planctomycetota bacterium]|nr:glycosyltransferase [Planctomycetota bacterium]